VYRIDIDRTPHYIVAGSVSRRGTTCRTSILALLPEIEVSLRFE
jgi:hypothetical protein